MRVHVFRSEQRVPRPVDEVFEFFSRAANLERITPPWLSFSIDGQEPSPVTPGTLIAYRLRVHGMPMRWLTRIEQYVPGSHFVDLQLHGPYRLWHHRHEFQDAGDGTTLVRDEVHYQLPLGILGAIAHLLFVRADIRRIFEFRRQAIEQLLGG